MLLGIASRTYMARLTALGLAFAGAGLFAIAKPALEAPQQQAPAIAITPTHEIQLDASNSERIAAPPTARESSRSISMIVTAQNATFIKLEDLDEASVPKHGKLRLEKNYGAYNVVGVVANDDVPAIHRARLGSAVTTGTCSSTIVGFAVIGRLTGSPGYAGDDTLQEWTKATVLKYGAPMLAAKLATTCDGSFVRDASLPPAIVATASKAVDAKLVAKAKRTLVASKTGRAATKEWAATYTDGSSWVTATATTWTAETFRHATTGAQFLFVQGHQLEGCGSPDINVYGLFHVDADGSLVQQPLDLADIRTVDRFVDLDNDGTYEVIGRAWLGDTHVNTASGITLEKLEEPFYGCPC